MGGKAVFHLDSHGSYGRWSGMAGEIWIPQMMVFLRSTRWTIAFAILCGFFLSLFLGRNTESYLWSLYDKAHPVADWHGTLVARDSGSVIVKVSGTKLRDCVFVPNSINSFTKRDGILYNADEQKIGGMESRSRPVGQASVGIWRIWPIDNKQQQVLMFVEHNCDGRIVMTKVIDLLLDEVK